MTNGVVKIEAHSIFSPATAVQKKLSYLLKRPEVRADIHLAYANRTEKYVPLDTGTLRETVETGVDFVRWGVPYAHYMNEGMVYGPNFPITRNIKFSDTSVNQVVGWYSIPNKKKHPTGKPIIYHTPGTGPHWETKVMENYVDKIAFQREVTQILKRYAKEE